MIAHQVAPARPKQETRGVTQLSACGLCLGDMIEVHTSGEIELVCMQCGHRYAAPVTKTPIAAR